MFGQANLYFYGVCMMSSLKYGEFQERKKKRFKNVSKIA